MEDIVLYPGVELEDFNTARENNTKIKIEMNNSSKFLYKKLETGEPIIEKHEIIELINSDSDGGENSHVVVESVITHDAKKLQIEEIKIVEDIEPSVSSDIHEIQESEHNLQDEIALPLLCRLCAIPGNDMIYIFGLTIFHENVIHKIQHCLPVTVTKSDNLSKHVCRPCIEKLESCYRFHKTVTQAEKQLLLLDKQTSGLSKKTSGIHGQTSLETNRQRIVTKTENDEETLTRISDKDDDDIEKIDFSDLAGDNDTGNSSCENQNTETFGDTCSAALSSPRNESCLEEELRTEKDSSDSVNHLPPNRKSNSVPREKIRRIPKVKSSYLLRKKEPRKYRIDNDDDASCNEDTENRVRAGDPSNKCQSIKCKICKRAFQTIIECRQHAGIHSSKNYYPCCFCNEILENGEKWNEHWLQHFSKKPGRKFGFLLKYGCDKCGKKYSTGPRLQYHKCIAVNARKCKKCDKVFKSDNSLQQHMIAEHNKREISFGKTHYPDSGEQKHKKRCFANRKTHPCTYCKRTFIWKCSLTHHLRIHTGERPYSCKICSKKFAYKSNYNCHLRVHTNERPFECSLCEQEFKAYTTLDHHIKRVHPEKERDS